MSKLLVLNGMQSGENISLTDSTLLSQTTDDSILVNSSLPSTVATRIQQKGHVFFLYPGRQILLNSEPLQEVKALGHGDFITIGTIQLLFDEDIRLNLPEKKDQDTRPLTFPSKNKGQEENSFVFKSQKTFINAESIVQEMVQSKGERRLATLFKVTHTISKVQDSKQLFDELLEILFAEFPAERCLIFLRENSISGQGKNVISRNRQGRTLSKPQISKAILHEVIDKKSSILTENALEDKRFESHRSIAEHEIHSLLAVPLVSSHQVHGMIQIDTTTTTSAFQPGDLEMLAGIAMQASVALEKFALELVKLEKEKLEKDLKLAGEIQRFMLPSKIPTIAPLEIALHHQFSQNLGGDYYDFIDKGNGIWVILLADVSGHSTASALIMAMARSILRQNCRLYEEPHIILEKSNAIIKEETSSFMYLTALLLFYHTQDGVIQYSGAGHPFPLLQREDKIKLLEKGGRPLGLMRKSTYEQQSITLRSNDRLFLYTDGASEAKNPQGENFGEARLVRFLKQKGTQMPPQQLIEELNQELLHFREKTSLSDDLTFLVLQQK